MVYYLLLSRIIIIMIYYDINDDIWDHTLIDDNLQCNIALFGKFYERFVSKC